MTMELPFLVAHRGASSIAPENTLAAFRLALDLRADGIELDVHMTADNEIVVIHDSTVDRTTGFPGRVGQMTSSALKALDAGSWFNSAFPDKARPEYTGLRIPLLREVLELVRGRARLYIEIKDPDLYPGDFESRLLSIVREHRMENSVAFLSFSRRSLRKIRRADPSTTVALLISRLSGDPIKSARALGAAALAVSFRVLNDGFAAEIREAGLGIIAWTVDDAGDIRRIKSMRVDSVITNVVK